MTLNLDTLRKTAEAATPGPWTHEPYGAQNQNGDYFGGWLLDADGEYVVADVSDRDGAFMAAANPETVLALLSRLEQAEQALDATERQVVARSGETAAERIWRGRAEQAEQAVARVREVAAEYRPSIPEEVLHEVMKDILRALDGDGRG